MYIYNIYFGLFCSTLTRLMLTLTAFMITLIEFLFT